MQKKLIIEKKDLDKTAIILVKDLNNILRQIEVITKLSQSIVDQFNSLGVDGYTWSAPRCVSLKDYSINDKDELIVQSKSND